MPKITLIKNKKNINTECKKDENDKKPIKKSIYERPLLEYKYRSLFFNTGR